MSFKSVLETIGKDALKVLHIGETIAVVASPVISAQFGPGIGSLVQSTAIDVMTAEQAANAAGQNASGAAKAAGVVQSLGQSLPGLEKDFGLTIPQDKQAAYVQMVYNLVQMFQPVGQVAALAPVAPLVAPTPVAPVPAPK